MAARLIYALAILAILVLTVDADKSSDTRVIIQHCNTFGVELYKQTHTLKPYKNTVTAGSFVWILLSLLSLGNTGASRAELKHALGLVKDDSDFEARVLVPIVVNSITKIKGIGLEEATRFYIKDDGTFTTDDYDVDAYRYGVEVEPLKLSKTENAARTINTWVQKKTHERVKGLISAKELGPSTSLILINSIFIKATWRIAFDSSQTKPRPFHLVDGSTVKVNTMETTGRFRYAYNKQYDAKILAIPLKGNEASVVFVLPSKVNGLPDLVKDLGVNASELFTSALKKDKESVKVRIPKILMETTTDLKTLLPKLGISSIFQRGKSGLSYILDSGAEVVVTNAVQKTIFLLNEKGENDYDDSISLSSAFSFFFVSPQEFFADRPFLAAVVPKNGPILYISQITNPTL